MRELDDTDREILRLLLSDGRQPYSEIADVVGLSAPAVSDRVDRLCELGVIERFTVEVDRATLQQAQPLLVTLDCVPGAGTQVSNELAGMDATEHVLVTADDEVVCTMLGAGDDVGATLDDQLSVDRVRDYTVKLLSDSVWNPGVGQADLALSCVECGNSVTREGEQERLDGDLYHFCCDSCRESFLETYDRLSEGA